VSDHVFWLNISVNFIYCLYIKKW